MIPLNKVPETLLSIAQSIQLDATFKTANIEKEDDVMENGDIQMFEAEYSQNLVPGAVMKAIDKKMPGFAPTYIEASYSESKGC